VESRRASQKGRRLSRQHLQLRDRTKKGVPVEIEAERLDNLAKAAKNAKQSLDLGNIEYTTRFLELLDEGLQSASEHLYEWLQIRRGDKEKSEENIDDKLSELMREWQAEKA
jgi:hypothetical protein